MAGITEVFYNSAASTTVSLSGSGVTAGDYIVVFAYRNTTTAPSLPTGFTTITNGSGNSNSFRMFYKVATGSETNTGTATNATVCHVGIYRNVTGFNLLTHATHAANTSTVFPSAAIAHDDGHSWVVQAGGSKQTTSQGNFATYTTRGTLSGTSCYTIFGDTNGGITSYSGDSSANGASATYAFAAVELYGTNTAPSAPTLSSPSDTATGQSTTPALTFTTTDGESDNIQYEVQVDTVNTFDSTTGSAPSVVQRNATADGAGGTGSMSVAFGSNNTSGNSIIAIVTGTNTSEALFNSELADVTDSKSNTYYKVYQNYSNLETLGVKVYVARGIASGANTVSVSSDTNNPSALFIYEVSNLAKLPLDKVSWNELTTSTTSFTSNATATTSLANELLLGVFVNVAGSGSSTYTAGGSFVNIQNQSATNANAAVEELVVSSTGTYTATATASASTTGIGLILTFKNNKAPLIDASSVQGDAGFSGTPPYASGASATYTVQSALSAGTTYYWRVAPTDVLWSIGSWSSTYSFTTSGGGSSASITQVAANLTLTGGTQVVVGQTSASITQSAANLTLSPGTQSTQVAVAQSTANLTLTGGTQAVTTTRVVSISQVTANLSLTGGTQGVATVNNVNIVQVSANLVLTGGTQSDTGINDVAITQVAANLTLTGGTQSVATTRIVSITQSTANLVLTSGTQVVSSGQTASVTQTTANLALNTGTQVVAATQVVSVTQSAANLILTGGTQGVSAGSVNSASITQVAANLLLTGGTQVIDTVNDASISQITASLTVNVGTQSISASRIVSVNQTTANLTLTTGIQSVLGIIALRYPYVNISGTWKTGSGMAVNVSGTWKDVASISTKVGGVWKT